MPRYPAYGVDSHGPISAGAEGWVKSISSHALVGKWDWGSAVFSLLSLYPLLLTPSTQNSEAKTHIDDGYRNSALLPCQIGLALALLESLKDKRQKNLENLLLSSKTRLRAYYLTVSSIPTLNVRSWALILGITAPNNFKLPSLSPSPRVFEFLWSIRKRLRSYCSQEVRKCFVPQN